MKKFVKEDTRTFSLMKFAKITYSSVNLQKKDSFSTLKSMLSLVMNGVNLAVHPPVSSSLYKIIRMNSNAEVIYKTKSFFFVSNFQLK
jgi:lipopolysaccharide/colanic/teichoic acid biosynthesis glycosyltransferase